MAAGRRGGALRRSSRRPGGALGLLLAFALLGAALPSPGHAGCCDLVKIDASMPPGPVRACEPDAGGDGCGGVLVEELLELGELVGVCASGTSIVYQETDPSRS